MRTWAKITVNDDFKSIWLKEKLIENNLTVAELARRLGVRVGIVNLWINRGSKEAKKVQGIRKPNFLACCLIFGMNYEDSEEEWKKVSNEEYEKALDYALM